MMEQLLEKLLGLDPAASSGITLVLLAGIVLYIMRMMNRSQSRASENQTQWINLITTTQAQFNTIGENVTAHTEALKVLTKAIAFSIGDLESTLITLTEQGLKHHDNLMKSQNDTHDGLDGLKKELAELTQEIKRLTSTIIGKGNMTSDSHVKLDTAIGRLNTITQTLERIKPNDSKTNNDTISIPPIDSPVGIGAKPEGH